MHNYYLLKMLNEKFRCSTFSYQSELNSYFYQSQKADFYGIKVNELIQKNKSFKV